MGACRRMIRASWLVLAVLVAAGGTRPGAAAETETLPTPPMDVSPAHPVDRRCAPASLPEPAIEIDEVPTAKPPIDRSFNTQQLTYLARQLGSQHSRAGRVLGLTKVQFSYRVGPLRFLPATVGPTVCLYPARIQVQLQSRQEVLVVRTSDAGSCWDKAILEHEMQHVGYNNEAIAAAAGRLRQRLTGLAAPVEGRSTKQAAQELAQEIGATVAQALTESVDAARIHHAELDAPGNRNGDRLRARCVR